MGFDLCSGYGDITAQDSWSRHLAGWVMKLGLFLYGYCVSVQAATLANLDAPRVGDLFLILKKKYNMMHQ